MNETANTPFQRPWIRVVTTVLALALMIGIFIFSNQGKQSETTSESFAFVIIDTVHPEYGEATQEEQIDIWNTAQRIVRKSAHVLEYLALGFLIRLCLESWLKPKPQKLKYLAIAIGALYAVSDEIHQYFVPGRSCEILDMLVDSAGVFLGVLLANQQIKTIQKYADGRDIPMEPWSKEKLTKSFLLSPIFGALLTLCLELGISFIRKDTPGSLPRHLAFFAVCTGLMTGAVLLCAKTKPVRRFWNAIDKNLLSPETRKPAIDIIYAALALPMLLHHFYVMLYYPKIPAGASKLAPIWIILAILTILLGKTWKHKGFLFTSFFLIYTFENLFLHKLIITGEAPVYFSSALYSLFLAYGVFFVLRQKYRKIFLQAFCAIWSVLALAYCAVGLNTAWAGGSISNLADKSTFVHKGRLWIFFTEPTITAANISCGTLVSLMGFSVSKHWPIKAAYLVSCFITIVTNSLTDARSSMYMISFALAGIISLALWGILSKRANKLEAKKRIALLGISIPVCFALCFILAHSVQSKLPATFTDIRDRGGIITTTAHAENQPTVNPSFIQRDSWDSSLSSRMDIWENAKDYIKENPKTLVFGLTADGSASLEVNRDDHCHNILIQTLMEGGIPGLLLFLALLAYFLVHAIRLWTHWDLPLWQRILPLPALSVLFLDMAECLTHFAFGHPPMTLLYFFMGCTIATSLSLKKDKAEETTPATED